MMTITTVFILIVVLWSGVLLDGDYRCYGSSLLILSANASLMPPILSLSLYMACDDSDGCMFLRHFPTRKQCGKKIGSRNVPRFELVTLEKNKRKFRWVWFSANIMKKDKTAKNESHGVSQALVIVSADEGQCNSTGSIQASTYDVNSCKRSFSQTLSTQWPFSIRESEVHTADQLPLPRYGLDAPPARAGLSDGYDRTIEEEGRRFQSEALTEGCACPWPHLPIF
ncbi:hypothetical protein Tco_0497197 [Tanacetum coccineum]